MIVKPVKKSYQLVSLPGSLNLYYTNTINDVGSVVTDDEGNTVTSRLMMDYLYNETAYYFDVTSYLTSMIAYDKDDSPAMLLSLPTGNWGYSLDRLVLGDYNHSSNAIRLKITYWKY
ncbi:MAG: hypothetical protein HC830_12895 [Bacteroidetes bacterium]|nr:hypothetical protein [Bacteroidota bacterium]